MEVVSDEQETAMFQLGPTSEAHITRHLGQRRVDDLLKVDLLVINVEERLARAETSFTIAQRTGRLVTIERLDVEDPEGL